MKDLTEEDRFLDFRTRIRNADSHSEAEDVLQALSLENVRRVCDRIVQEQGNRPTTAEPVTAYRGESFYVHSAINDGVPEWQICRNDEIVFWQFGEEIRVFKALPTWNVLNFLEEIAETGTLSL
jgi:hypothetical protein